MTTIRPNILPQNPQAGPVPQDAAKLAAAKAFFAAAMGQAQAPAEAAQPAVPPANRAPASGTEAPQKILRPGSLLDIRV